MMEEQRLIPVHDCFCSFFINVKHNHSILVWNIELLLKYVPWNSKVVINGIKLGEQEIVEIFIMVVNCWGNMAVV